MKRTNTFEVRPRSAADEEVLRRLLDASASLWNELTYDRRQRYFADENVWDVDSYYDRYKGVLSANTTQQIRRKNDFAWKSFFALLEDPDETAHPPCYWGNEDRGRELRTYIRYDSYTLQWGSRSRLEVPIGKQLKSEFGFGRRERLRLEVAGEPKWSGEQGCLELYYDETSETFRAIQPVTVPEDQQDSPLASHEAALDVGANNLVAWMTTSGSQYLYEGRDLFERFRKTTERIGQLAAELPDEQNTSKRINRLYKRRTQRHDHAQDALVRDLVERLYDDGVDTIYIGDVSGVLSTHWSVEVNSKLHTFWAFGRLCQRLETVCEEYGISLQRRSEAWTTQRCVACGRRKETTRDGDRFRCPCGYEAHADLSASVVFLERHTDEQRGSTARPVRLSWDNHEWRPTIAAPSDRTISPEHCTNRSTT